MERKQPDWITFPQVDDKFVLPVGVNEEIKEEETCFSNSIEW